MHAKALAALNVLTLLAFAPAALAQSGRKSSALTTATPVAAAAAEEVVTMMWDNLPTSAAGGDARKGKTDMSMSMDSAMSMETGMDMSMETGMDMSMGSEMTKTGMSVSGQAAMATGTAMEGMSMSGSASKMDAHIGVGWVVVSFGAGVGFLAGML
jgi:hypothetical protein